MPSHRQTLNYHRYLTSLAHGYPCNSSPCNFSTYPQFSEEGYKIGDIFCIESHRPNKPSFMFNIFDEKDHPRQFDVPLGFKPATRPTSFQLAEVKTFFQPNSWFLSSNVKRVEPEENILHEFQCTNGDGAFLHLPDGATREDLLDIEYLKSYIRKHAKQWYSKYPNVFNGSLFLVTGLDTARTFCFGSMMPDNPPEPARAQLIPGINGDIFDVSTTGMECGGVEPSEMPSPGKRSPSMPLFYRGYSIALSQADFNDILSQHKMRSDPPLTLPWKYRVQKHIYLWLYGSKTVMIPSLSVYRPSLDINTPYYLPLLMLQRLLPHIPKGSVGIIHDDSWCKVVREMDSKEVDKLVSGAWNKFADVVLKRYSVVLDDGIMTLQPLETHNMWREIVTRCWAWITAILIVLIGIHYIA